MLWDMTGAWPEGEQDLVQEFLGLDGINDRAAEYEKRRWEHLGFKEEEEQVCDEVGLRRCFEKLREYEMASKWWSTEENLRFPCRDKSQILVKMLEVAVVVEEGGELHAGEGLPGSAQILGWIGKDLHEENMIEHLTQSKKVWELLKDGALARAMGIKDEKVQELGAKVIETFKTRYEKGVQRSEMWDKSSTLR